MSVVINLWVLGFGTHACGDQGDVGMMCARSCDQLYA